jgi:hypothetical protein
MPTPKRLTRYAVTVDFYVYAENDANAFRTAKEMTEKIRAKDDNDASILELNCVPFGTRQSRRIDITEFQ